MKPKLIDLIRDLALKIEHHDIETSYILMN